MELALNQEQARVQQDLIRLREKEREALNRVLGIEKKLRKGEKLTPEDLEQLLQAEQAQQQIRERVGNEKEGLRAEVQRIRSTLDQNGLKNSSSKERMDAVARELDRLAEQELEQIEPKLTEARKASELLDERAQAERKAQREQKARESEREAERLQQQVEKEAKSVARAEEEAARATSPRDKAQKEAEVKRLQEQLAQLQKKAREQRAKAERELQEAGRVPDESVPRDALAEARQGQEEVEKTLGALLQEMEPWSSTREVKGEASWLWQEQKQLQKELEELAQKEAFTGKKPEDLSREQLAELENVRDSQKRLEERTTQLLEKMKRVAEQRADKDPETAEELRSAATKAEQDGLSGKMKEAAEHIQKNELNEAQRSQKEAVAELEKLARSLEDRREAELDRLIKKLREAEQKVEELAQEQEALKKKTEEAQKIADPAEREEALKKLARQQKALQEKTEEMVKQLSRLRSARAGQALGQAGEEMRQAGQQLQGGKRDDERQEEVLDRLDEAKRELERAREQAEEELGREQLARVADVIKRLRERHEALTREGSRIQADVQQRGQWTRGLKVSLRQLAENQKGLQSETVEVAKKDLGQGVPVFARLLEKAGEAMDQASQRAASMVKDSPEIGKLPDAELAQHQALALKRLTQLLDSLKQAQEAPRPLAQGGGGGEEGSLGKGGNDDGLPPLAQLKLLREMQKEINQRTETFKKKNPDLEKLGAAEQGELEAIRKEQKEVGDLLERLIRPAEGESSLGGNG